MKKTLNKGFTLIEIMIVVAILAILAAVAIPNFIKYRNETIEKTCKSNMATIKTATEAYLMANPSATGNIELETLCPSSGEVGYLKEIPTSVYGCTYKINVASSDSFGSTGLVSVSCSKHTPAEEQ